MQDEYIYQQNTMNNADKNLTLNDNAQMIQVTTNSTREINERVKNLEQDLTLKISRNSTDILEVKSNLQQMQNRMDGIQEELKQAKEQKQLGGGGRKPVLHMRDLEFGPNGIIIPDYTDQNVPRDFFEAIEQIVTDDKKEFYVNLNQGWDYYYVGTLIARHDAVFRRYWPRFSMKSLNEIKENKESRFYRDKRDINTVKNGRMKTKVVKNSFQ